MSNTDKRVRGAYEDGQKVAEETHSPLYPLSASGYSCPKDPELAEAFRKGLRGEQLDEDKKAT